MVKGKWIRTNEYKERLSNIHKNIENSGRFKLGQNKTNGSWTKGNIPWNKGLKNAQIPFWKNKIFSQEHRKKLSLSHTGKRHPLSEETRRKISISNTGKVGWNKGTIGIMKRNRTSFNKESRRNLILPLKDSKIELKTSGFLRQLGIDFQPHKYMTGIDYPYQCDFFIPSKKMIIECDGDYWHGNLEKYGNWNNLNKAQKLTKIKDFVRTKQLEANGFKVVRLWEKDIHKMDLNKFKSFLV